jgi:hypothetical protein
MGNPETSTYGEAITTPAGATNITSFSFWLQGDTGFEFQSFVSAWDNTNYALTGSMLYLSPVTTLADGNMDEFTFSGLNIPVTPGTIYQFGVTIDNVFGADSGFYSEYLGGDILSNGNSTYYFDWSNDLGNSSLLYTNWNTAGAGGCADNGGACGQAAYLVNYSGSAIPEPGTMTLIGSALLGLGVLLRKRLAR